MTYEIEHPSDLVKQMKAFPDAYLSLSPYPEMKAKGRGDARYFVQQKRFQLINPGSFEEGYFCLGVAEAAVVNLEDNNELQLVKDGRWKLK